MTKVESDLIDVAFEKAKREEAIAFAEWVNKQEKNNHLKGFDEFGWYYDIPAGGGAFRQDDIGSTNDLYELFKKEQKQ
jgi:hypothetical protein